VNEVGLRLGYTPPQLVEHRLTHAQLELQWHWMQRARAREQRIDEITLQRAVIFRVTGKPP
jgi:hypothetical protein